MNNTLSKIKEQRTQARINKDMFVANTLTTVVGDLETAQKRGAEIDDAYVVAYLKKAIQTAKENFKHSGGDDAFINEVKILEQYLPKQLTETELSDIVNHYVDNAPDCNIGQVMGYLKQQYPGLYDGKVASGLVKERLL